jgi:glycosyltransferase involved in cell wall biosynthesis
MAGRTNHAKISVAIATYNGARFIEEQLASIAHQSRPVDEVVIADDCSSDETVLLAERAAEQLGLRLNLLRGSARLGVVGNFQRAMLACRGELVFLSDQDDIWYSHKVEAIVAEFSGHPDLLAVFTDAVVVDERRNCLHESLLALSRLSSAERAKIRAGNTFAVLMTRNLATGATMAIRSNALHLALPVPDGWYHDEWIALALSLAGRVGLIDEPLIEYRQHHANTIGAPRPTSLTKKLSGLRVPRRNELRCAAERAAGLAARFSASAELHGLSRTSLAEKAKHLNVRSELPASKLMRLPSIARELANARYFHYSHGIRAALRDLLQRLD